MPDLVAAGGFVRSMATRGAAGGIAVATSDAVDVLDAAGFAWVLLETVGAGQDEVDVVGEVETVVVVTVAGLGDDVQAAKAGLMEIANVFAVNKADRPGADGEAAAIRGMLALAPPGEWNPPVILTSATTDEGTDELLAAVVDHQRFLDGGGRREMVRRRRARRRTERLLAAFVRERLRDAQRDAIADALAAGENAGTDPHAAAHRLLERLLKGEA
jgi:LAO/AO transport system kinase